MTLTRKKKALRILDKINKEYDKLKKLDYCFTDIASSIALVDNTKFDGQKVDNTDAIVASIKY